MKRLLTATMSVLLLAPATHAAAQSSVVPFDTGRDHLYVTFGLDPALVLTFGYARNVELGGHPIQFTGDLGVVAFGIDGRDLRARLGTNASVASWRSLHVTGGYTLIARSTENDVYRAFSVGGDLTGGLGLYRPGWFVGAEVGLDKALLTHFTHTDWYRDNFYADAKDGWYRNTGGAIHYGLAAGVGVGRANLVGRFGFRRTEEGNDLIPPMYVALGVGWGL